MIRYDQFECASLTDVGIRRSHNQDNLAVQLAVDDEQWRARGHLFLVADGMGAHAVGEKASEQAARIIPHAYVKHAQNGPVAALRKAFVEANASIHACGQANREFKGMGTTGSALLIRPEGAWVGHVGDSRVYRIRNGIIEQLTYDHSMLWEYARIRNLDPDDVDIPANVIHRSLGPEATVKVDVEGPHPLGNGDLFLLCSDGLSGQVNDMELGAVATLLPPGEACRFLVDLANVRGGPDNITVQVIRVHDGAESNGVAAELPRRRKSIRSLVPWWVGTLTVGFLLSGAAAYMAMQELKLASIPTFVFGAAAIAAGVVGMVFHYRKEHQSARNKEEELPPARIHRRKLCHVEPALIEKWVNALETLRQSAVEKKTELDWALCEQHTTRGQELVNAGDLPGGFREYCRAMLTLTTAMNRIRHKEEVFRPTWDKVKNAASAKNAEAIVTKQKKDLTLDKSKDPTLAEGMAAPPEQGSQ